MASTLLHCSMTYSHGRQRLATESTRVRSCHSTMLGPRMTWTFNRSLGVTAASMPISSKNVSRISARMEKLWTAWRIYFGSRTIVFCCSQRHALFTRNWLQDRGVKAAAVFAGTGSDSRGESLRALVSGELDAICAVDLFNEGLDVPDVDRVVMLRPTESKVIFLQQLGRGLRAAESKPR